MNAFDAYSRHAYLATTRAGDPVLALGPARTDLPNMKLWWDHIDDPEDMEALTNSLRARGYTPIGEPESDERYEGIHHLPVEPLPDTESVSAKQAAAVVGVDTNTFRVYSRRGQAPRPVDDGKHPRWLDAEVAHWGKRRVGQGTRTDLRNPVITEADSR